MDVLYVSQNKMSDLPRFLEVFAKGPSRFIRWSLSPLLLLFAVVLCFPVMDCVRQGRFAGIVVGGLAVVVCLVGFLALWGVPRLGRLVTAIVGVAFGWYLVDQCFINFHGSWGFGAPPSATTAINSILGFIVFGLPCLLYTFFGRATFFPKNPDTRESNTTSTAASLETNEEGEPQR